MVTIPTIVYLIKPSPEEIGLLPDGGRFEGKRERPEGGIYADSKPFTAAMASKTVRFWMLSIANLLYAIGVSYVFTHLVPLATDIGIKPSVATAVLGFTLGLGIFGKVGIGFLAEKRNKDWILIFSFMLLIISFILLMLMKSIGLLYAFALIFGLFYSGGIVIIPLLSVEYFGLRSYGEIYGYLMVFFAIGSAGGPLVAGYIFDITKSYNWAFIIIIVGFILAAIAILFARQIKPKII